MTIGLLGAMIEEIEPLLKYFDKYESVEYADNIFYTARYKDHDIVIAYSKIGKVYASLTATIMIERFKAEYMLFSGVAGAISEGLKIGDLVVATSLCQHDLDITAFGHPHGFVPGGRVCYEADKRLVEFAKDVAKEKGVSLKEGIVATGDQFVADLKRKKWVGDIFEADALEMEGAAVAVVAHSLGVPFLILRSISDAADMDAGFDFDEFLKSSAVKSADFLMSILDRVIEKG